MLRHIPNALTCCNLLCGALGIVYVLNADQTFPVAVFVWLALVFDFLDGYLARILHVSSPLGKELDSLADMISFGLLPSVFMFATIKHHSANPYLPYLALCISVFSALRLAKFNIDESQADSFKGLPTPANALLITGLPFLSRFGFEFLFQPLTLILISMGFSFLLVSRIELFALKFKDFTWRNNKMQFTFLFFSVLLLVSFKFAAIPLIIIFYILLSLSGLVATGQRVQ
jgi:CDP-diacylglycerol---serine O-phosphatidyltransferase